MHNRSLFNFLVIFGLLTAFSGFSEEKDDKPIITILDFQVSNISKDESLIFTDFLMSYIIETHDYRVIDRNQRASILNEIEFSTSGCSDEQCQIEIGRLLAANQIIVGSLGKVGDRFLLNIKLIDVKTGETIKSGSEKYKSLNNMIDDSKRMILNFINKSGSKDDTQIVTTEDTTSRTKDELEAMPEQELKLKKQKLSSLFESRKYRDPNSAKEIQGLSVYLNDFEKSFIFKQYQITGSGWNALGNLFYGLGSWLQGDILGGVLVTGSMVGGVVLLSTTAASNVSTYSGTSSSTNTAGYGIGMGLIVGGMIVGVILPFIFEGDNNKALREALVYYY